MLTIYENGLTVVLYESPMAMPADLYQKARVYEVMGAELGSTEEERDAMLSKALSYGAAGMIAEMDEQIYNYRLARGLSLDGFQPSQLEWCCHVYSVNKEPVTDYSETALLAQIPIWSAMGLTQQLIRRTLADVKKNSEPI